MKTRTVRPKTPAAGRAEGCGLDKNSGTPLYAQLARIIRKDITSGKWQRGDTLPTEMEMTSLYGVSRITVRGALARLVDEGFIYRQKGKGSVVKQGKLTPKRTRPGGDPRGDPGHRQASRHPAHLTGDGHRLSLGYPPLPGLGGRGRGGAHPKGSVRR